MDKYVIDLTTKRLDSTAQYKAKNDITKILEKQGFKKVSYYYYDNKILKMLSLQKVGNILKKIKSGIVVYQFPLGSKKVDPFFLKKIRSTQEIKKIAIIHDLESLRNHYGEEDFKKKELEELKCFDAIIAQNNIMRDWLKKERIKSPIVSLEIFDYLDSQFNNNEVFNNKILFAGNLQKAGFLKKICSNSILEIYGASPASEYPKNVVYKGVLPSDELVKQINQSFGLIWDGESLNECTGVFGNYEKYNSPHKFSLYLSTGTPVIVWKKSAVADFVKKYKVGIVIDSLLDLDRSISKMTEIEYKKIKKNAVEIGKKIQTGYFTTKAINYILKQLG